VFCAASIPYTGQWTISYWLLCELCAKEIYFGSTDFYKGKLTEEAFNEWARERRINGFWMSKTMAEFKGAKDAYFARVGGACPQCGFLHLERTIQ